VTTSNGALLTVSDVKKYFPVSGKRVIGHTWLRAVDGVSFTILSGEALGLVGESGSGKTTTSRLVLRLDRPTSGSIHFRGEDISSLRGKALRDYRAATQAVFQDPYSSLNPRMRVTDLIAEPLVETRKLDRQAVADRTAEMLRDVGLEPAMARSFPHEFSGGQRQRIAIARALAAGPELIVLDEPVSALDVSIRAQIMNLLKDLQDRFHVSYLLIAHNLATVRYLCHDVAVMYLGQIVEHAKSEELFTKPLHPYTQALISAATPARPDEEVKPIVLEGEIPSPTNPPPGCRFHTRCPFAFDRCRVEVPALRELAPGHVAACHLY
jgi:oligopeptide/dipeptide ABC transporter ATP-binding protein